MPINTNIPSTFRVKTKKILSLIILCVLMFSTSSLIQSTSKDHIIYIQPLGSVDSESLMYLKKSVEDFYGYECSIKTKLELTNDILSKSKTRYDANKILSKYNSNINLLLITEKDIAYKKSNQFPEWGIFGLGLRPGKTCVVSTFRLKRKVTKQQMLIRLKKVALHEIGHNLGLSHCKNNKECMMNDADGTIKQVDREKIWFCEKCWGQIKKLN
ncbi:matrixin family metalloprotease [Flavobacterium aciduliphilum]|uniref:Archaemetzincin n=1 Tax=Flavobacterium aciduliphilum TaxID=1101402 RepID=A0A328YT31_9FLAO|nr:matrixin family metalloprotease [Flavobacterium aciduliphilum]RAR73687.1 archaemetzincin [Flavobacterium aciduliphilum]